MARQIYKRQTRTQQGRNQGRRVGQAIGTIGKQVGDAYDKLSGDVKKRKQDKKIKDAKAAKAQDDKLAGLKTTDLGPDLSGGEAKYPTISEIPPKKITPPGDITPPPPPPTAAVDYFQFGPDQSGAQPRGAWQGPLTHPTGDIYSTQQDPNLNIAAGERFAQRKMEGQRTQQYEGPGGFSNISGRNPINRISPEYTKSPFRRNPYGNSPLKRMSPLKAAADEISAGSQYVEQLQGISGGVDQGLGEIGAAGAAGYNEAIEKHNYKQRVWAEKAKDLDDAYGKLQVPPTGVSSWDASAQVMAKEWKDEFTDLYNNKDDYSYEEYASRLSDIKGRASNYQNANQNIKQLVADYESNKDNISASTPSSSIDILETLAKGGDGLTTQNVDGVPTLVGTTLGGQDVSVPISEIASGKNLWRVNQQYDVEPQISTISDQLGKFRTQIAQNGGISTQQVPWKQLAGRAESKIDGILSNPQRAQAIAAERFGIDYDEWQEMGDEAAMAQVKQGLMQEVEKQFQPFTQVQTGIKLPPKPTNTGRGGTAGERNQAAAFQAVGKLFEGGVDIKSPEGISQWNTVLAGKGLSLQTNKKGDLLLAKNGKGIAKVDPNDPEVLRQLAVQSGVSVGDLGKLTPLQRQSPFKRLTNWMSSPFKKKDKKKAPKGLLNDALYIPDQERELSRGIDENLYLGITDPTLKQKLEYKYNPYDQLKSLYYDVTGQGQKAYNERQEIKKDKAHYRNLEKIRKANKIDLDLDLDI